MVAYLGFHKIFFDFESCAHGSIVLSFLPPTCISHTVAILVHDYWAADDPPPDPPCVRHIHHTLLAITISCKGQSVPWGDELVVCAARGLAHDVGVGRVESEGGGGRAVGDQVDPEELDRDEALGEAE